MRDHAEHLADKVRLREPHFRADPPTGDLTVRTEEPPSRWIGEIVACIADDRRREGREPDLGKEPVDRHSISGIDLLVEEFRALNLVRAAQTDDSGDPASELGAERSSGEVETRSVLLFERPGEKCIGRASEHARLAVGADDTVLSEAS